MTVYLLHFGSLISEKHTCQHYLGWTPGRDRDHLLNRISSHIRGRGARLTQVAQERGIGFNIARIWWGGSTELERQLKRRKNSPRLCPYCQGKAPGERPSFPPKSQSAHLLIRRAEMSLCPQPHEYPTEIRAKRSELLRIEQNIRQLSDAVAIFSEQFDEMVAFDETLANEAQRKAKRAKLRRENEGYTHALAALQNAQDAKVELEIDLQFLCEEFSWLKLERRERIALREGHWAA